MDQSLRLHPGQRALTAVQRAEAERFASVRIAAQLATEPVDEVAAEAFLSQAYVLAGLPPPRHIHWLDGPLALVAALAQDHERIAVAQRFKEGLDLCALEDARAEGAEVGLLGAGVQRSVDWQVTSVWLRTHTALSKTTGAPGMANLLMEVAHQVGAGVWRPLITSIGDRIWEAIGASTRCPVVPEMREQRARDHEESILWHGSRAYEEGYWLAAMHFFDAYFVPNEAHAIVRFNELVSGYWLGRELALVVRRPRLLARDARGRLHSGTGPCVEYYDGWGFTAWHGVRVPERVILAPEGLTREDYLGEPDLEVRRAVQERMGDRFVWEMEGRFIDGGPQGVLYEVDLLDDPERVARYVQVRDASTGREHCLRVPPTTRTATEAVAWGFGLPAQET